MHIKFTSPLTFINSWEEGDKKYFTILRKNLWFRDDMRWAKNKTIFEIGFYLDHPEYKSVIFIVKEDRVGMVLRSQHGTHKCNKITIENPELLMWWDPIE